MHEPFWMESKVWVAIAYVVFFIIFGKRLWTAMCGMLDNRANAVRAELAEAARLRREAEDMLREAHLRRDRALDDAQRMIAGAQAEAQRLAAAAAQEAEASARRREQMAIDRIAAAEKAAVDEVRVAAAELATIAARQVIAEGLRPEQDAVLIEHSIRALPAALSRAA